ncbi:Ig-like domain-containing protein [Salipiger sp. P9]|uniref:Ig-like domain-containing protein n=1 Tax=Salipiger pentaromativorans TaxID=2943193 RepID=UPI002157869A|nr:Ig-like domain-containing protein [Salipiger pentaromativorans]
MTSYERSGSDLLVTLADGREIVLEGYFSGGTPAQLYLSADNVLHEVTFVDSGTGTLYAQYGNTETWGKWSPSDDLLFYERPAVVAEGYGEEEVSMFAPGLLGAGMMGGAGMGAAVLGGAALLGAVGGGDSGDGSGGGTGGGGDDGGSDGGAWIPPTVNDANIPIVVGGTDDPRIVITGTGTPGSTVTVTIGTATGQAVVDSDRTWEVVFEEDNIPEDGTYDDVNVTVVEPDDTVTDLDGPDVTVDLTPPDLEIVDGTVSVGDIVNAEDYQDGVTVDGTAEVGSTVQINLGDYSETVVVGDDGHWSFTFDGTVVTEGEYVTDITVSATDPYGNTTVVTDALDIDTVPHPLTIDPVAGDDLVNAAEAEEGFAITGTSTAGATVIVGFGDATYETVVGADGIWSVAVSEEDFAGGEYIAEITATTVDRAGNISSAGAEVQIDTVGALQITGTPLTGDDIFNAEEFAGGVTLTGTSQPGSTVMVEIGGMSQEAAVAADGTWSVTVTGLSAGTYVTEAVVTATDPSGNVETASHSFTVDTEISVTLDSPIAGDGVVNASEAEGGVALTGSAEAGATVTVEIGGTSYTTVATDAGLWSVTVPSGDIAGGTYTTGITVSAVDVAGNATTTTGTLSVDTETSVALTGTPLTGDDVINAQEMAGGLTLTGTAEPGATVMVAVAGLSQEASVDASGAWTVTFTGLPSGSYDTEATVTATDAAGNSATATHAFAVDTEAGVTLDGGIAGDGVVNAVEAAGGVALSGSAEPGASVVVEVGGNSYTTMATASGVWTVTLPASDIASGTYGSAVTVTATDAAGNVATTSGSFAVDTETAVTLNGGIAGDGVVNAAEAAGGVALSGNAEPGASVVVEVAGTSYTTTATGAGVWTVTVPAADVAAGTYSSGVTVTATDAAGNVATTTGGFDVDTETAVALSATPVEGDGIVNAAERGDGVTLTGTAEPGASVAVTLGAVTHAATVDASGNWAVSFAASEIPEGETTLPVTAVSTDAAGNSATASGEIAVDTLVRNFGIASTPGGADGVINAEEAAEGLTLTGTTEPGASVQITLNGLARTATVDADGNWTVTYSAAELPSGEQTVALTATSTDAAGNTETLTQNVVIDTEAGLLTISPDPVEGDDVVNAAEASDGVVITGTSTPGQMVEVTMEGVTHTVQTGSDGVWEAPFSAAEIAPGTYTAEITATITDAAGNTLTRTDTVAVDTEVVNFAISDTPVETDDVVNAAEASDGIVLTGTTEPGSSVTVTFEGTTRTATVDAAGNWSASFTAAEIPDGQYDAVAEVSTTDPAGNTATASASFAVDTYVDRLATSDEPITEDNVLNAEEARAGFTLTGVVEAGSTVAVTVGGVVHEATVEVSGAWSVDIPGAVIPTDATALSMQIEAVDAAGNSKTITESVALDTVAPDTPDVESYTRDHTGLRGITLETGEGDVAISHVTDESGAVIESVDYDAYDIAVLGETAYSFKDVVPDGSHLVVTATDDAGNLSGTYLVVDDTTTSEVTMTGQLANALSEFNIETIDLQFAEESALTITEAQLVALSSHTDTLTVEGGSDDSVTILGASHVGNDGEGYNIFSLGDATLRIDEDITNVVI